MWVKFLVGDRLFGFISKGKFGSFKNPFARFTSLSELHFYGEDLFCWYEQKKWFLWAMAAAQAAENHGDEFDLS